MFLCSDDHKDHPSAWMCEMVGSRGPCESCGEVANCADCKYVPPEVRARVDELLARGGYR